MPPTDSDTGLPGLRHAPPKQVLWCLLAIDLAFAVVHLLHLYSGWMAGPHFAIDRDRGYAERFQYLQLLLVGAALSCLFIRTRQPVLLAWAGVFLYLTCDDALRLHERAGLKIAEILGYHDALGLRARDLGEMSAELVVGSALLPALFVGYRSADRMARRISRDLALLLAALVACGVGVDMLHAMVAGSVLDTPLTLLEDGGEMLVASLALYYLLQWLAQPGAANVAFRPSALLAR